MFFGIPIALAILSRLLGINFHSGLNEKPIEIVALSIFIPLFFSVQVMIYGMIENISNHIDNKAGESASDPKIQERCKRIDYLKEVVRNISYSILVGIVTILVLLPLFCDFTELSDGKLMLSEDGHVQWDAAAVATLNFLSIFLISHLALTFLLLVKRTHGILLGTKRDKSSGH